MKKNLEYYRVIKKILKELAHSDNYEQQKIVFLELKKYIDSVALV